MAGRVTNQCFPLGIIIKNKGIFTLCGFQPIFQPCFYGVQHFITGLCIAHLIGNFCHLNKLVHYKAFVIRICPCCKTVVFQ